MFSVSIRSNVAPTSNMDFTPEHTTTTGVVPSVARSATVAHIYGDDTVSGVGLLDTVTGAEKTLDVSGLFIAIGSDPRTHVVHGQLDLTDQGTIAVRGRTSLTNLEGVFAAGDVIDPSYRQAITAAGSGCVAALDAQHYLESLPHDAVAHATAAK